MPNRRRKKTKNSRAASGGGGGGNADQQQMSGGSSRGAGGGVGGGGAAAAGEEGAAAGAGAGGGLEEEPLLPPAGNSGADEADVAGADADSEAGRGAAAAAAAVGGDDVGGNDDAARRRSDGADAASAAPAASAASSPRSASSPSSPARRAGRSTGRRKTPQKQSRAKAKATAKIDEGDYDKVDDAAIDLEEGGPNSLAEPLLPNAHPVEPAEQPPKTPPLEAELVIEADAESFADRLLDTSGDDGGGLVRIVAPATLPPLYSFVATLPDGRAFTVTVSSDGVAEGETFAVPFPRPDQFLATTVVPPRGYWKDGLWGCCALGCCHPTLWLSWCCPLVALGQVNTRLQLSWLSTPAPPRIVKWTFTTLVVVTVAHFTVTSVLSYLGRTVDTTFYRAESIVSLCMVLFRIYVVASTRRRVRTKYEINESACSGGCCCGCFRGCEDGCAALFCTCCAVSQMLRHTADYETFRSTCCTGTGLPPNAPVVV